MAVTSVTGFLIAFLYFVTSDLSSDVKQCIEEEQHPEDENADEQDGATVPIIARQRKRQSNKIEQNLDTFNNDNNKDTNEKEEKKDKIFSTLTILLLSVHLFWIAVGSFCILPIFFMVNLSESSARLFNCKAPVKFWVTFLVLCLQWLILVVFAVWWMVERCWGRKETLRTTFLRVIN